MNMNKLYAGLIAFVAGVALSAGSAFAQTMGYVGGDPAMVKLVPYYETGDMKATIIGIQNMSPQEQDTMDRNADVADIQAYLDGGAANPNAAALITAAGVAVGDNEAFDPDDLNKIAAAQAALEMAMEEAYTEHLFVVVSVYDALGMMHESKTMCLAENQFGVAIIQGPAATMMDTMQRVMFSAMDDDVHEFGYAMVTAENRKFSGCGVTAPDALLRVNTSATPGTGDPTYTGANSKVAAWTIIQDVGMGFFGTEVPTTTVSMASNAGEDATETGDDGDPEVACYSTPETATQNELSYGSGDFDMTRCGLIPERHTIVLTGTAPDQTLDVEGATDQADDSSTVNTTATARYDAGAESTVVVWLAKGGDMDDTLPRDRRMIEVAVVCADGMMPAGPDMDGDNLPDPVEIPAPHVLNRIDPTMGAVGDLTSMCDDYRGVLQITMPDYSHAGMVFTHITQMMGQYRMNFPGYSMAPDVEIDATAP